MSTPADQLPPAPPPGAPPGMPPAGAGPAPAGGPAAPPPPPPPMAQGGEPAPGGAPAATPQAPRGDQAAADAKMQMAFRLMEDAMVAYGAQTKRGRVVLKMLHSGAGEWAHDEERAQAIMPAEIKSALMSDTGASAGGGGGAPPPPAGAAPPGLPPGGGGTAGAIPGG